MRRFVRLVCVGPYLYLEMGEISLPASLESLILSRVANTVPMNHPQSSKSFCTTFFKVLSQRRSRNEFNCNMPLTLQHLANFPTRRHAYCPDHKISPFHW